MARASDLTSSELKAMLAREDELRLGPAAQECFRSYRLAGLGEEGMTVVVEQVQERVAVEFGIGFIVCKEALRCAEALLPGDPDVKGLSLYRRFNRCVDGPLVAGTPAPNAWLRPVSPTAKALAAAATGGGGVGGETSRLSLHNLLASPPLPGSGGSDDGACMPLVVIAGSYT